MAPAPRRSARVASAAAPAAPAPVAAPKNNKKKTAAPSKKNNKRKAAPAAAAKTAKKTRKTGLQTKVGKALVKNGPLGVIDPEAGVDGTIVEHDGAPCDVLLALVDPSQNSDKYYILQWIHVDDEEKEDDDDDEEKEEQHFVHTRWGRTGTKGQAQTQTFTDKQKAQDAFLSKFQSKTGLAWTDRDASTVAGKYRVVQQDFAAKQSGYTGATWQYWVDDGVDGKADGWYDYDADGSASVEQLYLAGQHNTGLQKRWVESGQYTYEVDLTAMTQSNIVNASHKSRHIRRVPQGQVLKNDPPAAVSAAASTATASTTKTTATKAPPATPAKAAPATVTPSTTPQKKQAPTPAPAAAAPAAAAKPSGSHPVDPDVTLHGKRPSDWTVVYGQEDGLWYDAVLNQCNITGSSNNNKYYRLQVLESSSNGRSSYGCWQKWGRVGEPARGSSSAWKASSTLEGAIKEYAKKFKDKTSNAYNSGTFVPKKGKYTLIEIDHDVQVTEEAVGRPLKSDVPEVEYLPSTLDPVTTDLIQVLFSKEMRDEALVSFNLDLKRLPLGVPSKTQIEHGVSILNKIQNKINGNHQRESYDELTSQFFTAIPHSFGRSRPPSIASQAALQTRYDVCDILMDMYSTNETVRKIEKEQEAKNDETKVQQLPNPVDLHYQALKTELAPVDGGSDEFQMIQTYFDKTKSNPRSQLLNAWTVDRKGEGGRFQKFDKLDNRRLLWHGTNIAVVAPILTSGLRIMPHSGGRVGAGIYLAAMQEKSAQYTSGYGAKYACMFLVEAALGKMHPVTSDGSHASSLRKAPPGFDSVHAVGKKTPKEWTTTTLDNKTIQVPKSEAEETKTDSSFYHDEFLAYEEAQVRIRYMLTVKL